MDLLGWYDLANFGDRSEKELIFERNDENGNPVYTDDRPVQKYYQSNNGKYLTAFEPQY